MRWPGPGAPLDIINVNMVGQLGQVGLYSGRAWLLGWSFAPTAAGTQVAVTVTDGLDPLAEVVGFARLLANTHSVASLGSPGIPLSVGLAVTVATAAVTGSFTLGVPL